MVIDKFFPKLAKYYIEKETISGDGYSNIVTIERIYKRPWYKRPNATIPWGYDGKEFTSDGIEIRCYYGGWADDECRTFSAVFQVVPRRRFNAQMRVYISDNSDGPFAELAECLFVPADKEGFGEIEARENGKFIEAWNNVLKGQCVAHAHLLFFAGDMDMGMKFEKRIYPLVCMDGVIHALVADASAED